ncbi:acetyl/propionyl/methylcrotonyl-CoA carboxylase subunit alpha [Rhodococcus erythropolis]|uniref:acetyl/propionyl/methylcrotonyl-CoA carboxylase subunit alpha n=1 Tax=Rhodococcus erythropolis TaxID=1833 RepID=UPI002948C9FA|nr:acetyl/propionyl/methylcrotonyl-CoA carboxylase subunit alpha [Rhodococcus erythropolis]MDV6212795.1 acetyl/propionyl/methylcrotonyl-CoA carboxylase subunit alpha [Rhodococcus erythropolis]
MTKQSFDTILVANRGEIAIRIMRSARNLGLRTVAVYSDADSNAQHVHYADVAVRIGPAAAAQSYLSIPTIIGAAKQTGAGAIHPGYGFLAENADFARACADADLVFIGPPATAVDTMGDKIRAKRTVVAAGVPVTPGLAEPGLSDEELIASAEEIGYPVLIKPSAGGGGKGMHRVDSSADIARSVAAARREAKSSFGDDTLFIERFVSNPRHIEIQVLADTHGTVVHLGERECSLQRRHQKVIEEAPSVLLTPEIRERMGTAAVEAARAVGYTGAGTVEFIVSADAPDEFFFMEMNTRLQVEHPVTEMITGIDLVEQQLRVAAGERLDLPSLEHHGHSVEARVYAEDPSRGFLPTGGTVLDLREPSGPHVRVDTGLRVGDEIGSSYDPMLAKIITWGRDRTEALRRLDRALAELSVVGVRTNVPFLRRLLADPDVRSGKLDTGLIERRGEALTAPSDALARECYIAAAVMSARTTTAHDDPFAALGNWSVQGPHPSSWPMKQGGSTAVVSVFNDDKNGEYRVTVEYGEGRTTHIVRAEVSQKSLLLTVDGITRTFGYLKHQGSYWFTADGDSWNVEALTLDSSIDTASTSGGSGELRSPMPGTVVSLPANMGDVVSAGDPVVIVEAMKMEHTLVAPFDGTVSFLPIKSGDAVAMDAHLATIEAIETGTTQDSVASQAVTA